jgi:hypothetical protein
MIPLILGYIGAYLVGSELTKKKTDSYKGGGKMAKGGMMAEGGVTKNEVVVFIKFRNAKKNFNVDTKYFRGVNAYQDAVKWGRKNISNFNMDMVKHEMASGGYMADGGVIYLESVGTYFRPSDLATSVDGKFEDESEIFYLNEIDNYEWWRALSKEDKKTIEKDFDVDKFLLKEFDTTDLDAYHKESVEFFEKNKKAKGGKLVGNQKKLDLNKNGKLDAEDFKMLRENKK